MADGAIRRRALALTATALALALLLLAANGRLSFALPGTTERVSVDSAGNEGNDHSWGAAISADGRYVAFFSYASNLVPGDTNGYNDDVFVHDRETGATTRVSVDSAGNEGNSASANPAINADGRYVAFASQASNLVPGDTNDDIDVFVHDRQTRATERVSVDSAGNEGNWWSQHPAISSDGRYVAFVSGATNLVSEGTNGYEQIFLHDRDTDGDGILDEAGAIATKLLSVEGNMHSTDPSMSPDGRYVVFASWASNLVLGDANGVVDIFVHDRDTDGDGVFDETGATATEWVSVDSAGNQGNEESRYPAISADGRYVAFASWASNLVPDDTNGHYDIFVHDRQTGVTERVSVSSAGNEGNAISEFPAISADGRYVAFQSQASNLVPGDGSDDYDIFVHDRQTGTTERVSVDNAGNEGNEWSRYPAISADGRYVAFESSASNLVPDDANARDDILVHDRLGIPPTPTPTPTSAVTPELTPPPQPPAPETPTPEVPPTAAPSPPPGARCFQPEFERFEVPSFPFQGPTGMVIEANTYCGNVTINGQPAPDGTLVEAVAEGEVCASVETQGGLYRVIVPLFLCPQDPVDDLSVVFLVAGTEAKEKGHLASPVSLWLLDLTVEEPTPAVTPTPQPTPTPNVMAVVTPEPVKTPAMLPATGGGGLLDDNGLPQAAVLATMAVMALTAGTWYARRRRAR